MRSVYSCSINICALGFNELLESIFSLLLLVEVFSLQKLVEMLKKMIVTWQEVRWIWQMRQNIVAQLNIVENFKVTLNFSAGKGLSTSVLITFSVCVLTHVWLFSTPWTVAHQAPLSLEFSGQEYWSGLPFPFPGDLPGPGIEPASPVLQADSLLSEALGKPSDLRTCHLRQCITLFRTLLLTLGMFLYHR